MPSLDLKGGADMKMKRIKQIFSFPLVALLIMGLSVTTLAAESSVTFEENKVIVFEPGSTYTDTDLFDNFKAVMPGDTLYENITIENQNSDYNYLEVYMRAILHDEDGNPISDKVLAELTADGRRGATPELAYMLDFLSKLSIKVWKGTDLIPSNLIYEGSPNQLDGLAANVYLGMLGQNESLELTVELTVPLELDNEYANRIGEVDWVFYVEAYNDSQLSVRKVWTDGNADHEKDSVTVNLLMDGKVEKTQILNAENNWAYTFDSLVEGHTYAVEEAEVPSGYTVSYNTVGTMTTITNERKLPPGPPTTPLDINVRKVWSSDDPEKRPDSVTVTLYNGLVVYDTVRLGAWNNWSCEWSDLSEYGNWQAVETNIPKGYVPSYRVNNGVVTITNTRSLIQTGQLNWPIWVLGGAGLALVALGMAMLVKKKKRNEA